MNKKELIESLAARRRELTKKDIGFCVDLLLGAIVENLAQGGRVEFRGFGVFRLYRSLPRLSRNPLSGEPVTVPPRGYIRFRSTIRLAPPAGTSRSSDKCAKAGAASPKTKYEGVGNE